MLFEDRPRSSEGDELKRMVAGFARQAHLAADLSPGDLGALLAASSAGGAGEAGGAASDGGDPAVRMAAATNLAAEGPAQSTDGTAATDGRSDLATEGVPAGSALLLSIGAFALGLAFQNQKAWAEMSSSRYSRGQYTALI